MKVLLVLMTKATSNFLWGCRESVFERNQGKGAAKTWRRRGAAIRGSSSLVDFLLRLTSKRFLDICNQSYLPWFCTNQFYYGISTFELCCWCVILMSYRERWYLGSGVLSGKVLRLCKEQLWVSQIHLDRWAVVLCFWLVFARLMTHHYEPVGAGNKLVWKRVYNELVL